MTASPPQLGTRRPTELPGNRFRYLAWSLLIASTAITAFGIWFTVTNRQVLADLGQPIEDFAGLYVLLLTFTVPGIFLAIRMPMNPIGWLMACFALCWIWPAAAAPYGFVGLFSDAAPYPLADWALWSATWTWMPGYLTIGLVLFLYPTGRVPSPVWRPLPWIAIIATAAGVLSAMFHPRPLDPELGGENPLAIPAAESLLSIVEAVGTSTLMAAGLAAVGSLVFRFRRSSGTERQQLRWLVYAVAVAISVGALTTLRDVIGSTPADPIIDALGLVALLTVGLIPATMAIAILRYGLYDLGRVVNLTVVYVVLVVLLVTLYAVSVFSLREILPLGQNDLAVAASTLAVAALFNPIRGRVQRFVDRRFHRSRYDSQNIVEEFAAGLRDEVVVESLTKRLIGVVHQTVQPSSVTVWVRPPTVDDGDSSGR